MKTGLRAALSTDLNPAFFGLACLLLISVFLAAKVMADDVGSGEGYEWVVRIPKDYPWLAAN